MTTATPGSAELLAWLEVSQKLSSDCGLHRVAQAIQDARAEIVRLAAKPAEDVRDATRASEDAKLAVTIREGMIETCAKLCDGLRRKDNSYETADWTAGTLDCAIAIRALSTTGQPKP